MFIAPLAFLGSSALAESEPIPASKEDLALYRGFGTNYLCHARRAGIAFPKALGIASTGYVEVITSRHGGFVAEAGSKKQTPEQLFSNAQLQVVHMALKYCPKQIPKKVKKKHENLIKKLNKQRTR